jgi:glycosyltransferase involved in cell wall biosynthesis
MSTVGIESKQPLHIGILIGRFPPEYLGGAELQAQQVACQLAKKGHRVTVFTRRYRQHPYQEEVDGYTIFRRDELPIPGLRMVWDTVPAVWHIAHRRPRLDALLCYQTLNSGLIGVVAQTLLHIPMVLSVRGNREYRLGHSTAQHLLVPPIFKQAKRVVVQSARILDDMYEQFQLVGKEKLVNQLRTKTDVIPNGIYLPPLQRSRGKKIVYVGRLIINKGVADLLEAMKQLPNGELIIVGDGPDRERLEGLAKGLPVTFVGQVAPGKVPDYLQQARVLVLPSHLGDGFPNVILEAMACGVPVVATSTAGIPDLVRHQETGYLFKPGDIDQLAAYINQLLRDDNLWEEFGRHSIEMVRSYSWEMIIPQIERLLYGLKMNSLQYVKTHLPNC